jgi:hypothetical protein
MAETMTAEQERQILVANRWMSRHPEYKQSGSNTSKLIDYMKKNFGYSTEVHFTEDNLEKTFTALKGQLDLLTPDEVSARAAELRGKISTIQPAQADSPFLA